MKHWGLFSQTLILAVISSLPLAAQDWAPASIADFPQNALVAATDARGNPIHIIRAPYRGSLVPGKFSPADHRASVPWGGSENSLIDFEVYMGTGQWVAMSPGSALPEGAIVGGSEEDGTPLYIIRGRKGGLQVPGKYNADHASAYIPYEGNEVKVDSIEILVQGRPKVPSPTNSTGSQEKIWVASNAKAGAGKALPAGRSPDGTPSYLVRSVFEGSLIPGKFNPKAKTAYVPWGGKENPIETFELYVGPQEWQAANPQGGAPAAAVPVGNEADGTPLYAIRSESGKALVPGKYNSRSNEAFISLSGKEIRVTQYEFLVQPAAGVTPVPGQTVVVPAPPQAPAPANRVVDTTSAPIWLKSAGQFPPPKAVVFAANEKSVLYLVRGQLNGRWTPGYLDPTSMQAFLLTETGPVATRTYEVWGGGGQWKAVSSLRIPQGALKTTPGGRQEENILARVRTNDRVLPAFYSMTDGIVIAYDKGQRIEFREAEILMPDWSELPFGPEEFVQTSINDVNKKDVVPYRIQVGNQVLVGRFELASSVGIVTQGGKEVLFRDWQGQLYLGAGTWLAPKRGLAPDSAVPAGTDAEGSPLYSIRSWYQGGWALGQFNERLNTATVGFQGKEIVVGDFEVLCYPGPREVAAASAQAAEVVAAPPPKWGQWPTSKTNLPFVRPGISKAQKIVPAAGYWSGRSNPDNNQGIGNYGKTQVFLYEGTKNEPITISVESDQETPGFYLIAPSGLWLYHNPLLNDTAEAILPGEYRDSTVLPETGTYTVLVNYQDFTMFQLRWESKAQSGVLGTQGAASIPLTASEAATLTFRVVTDGFSPVVRIVDAKTKNVLAESQEFLDNGKMAFFAAYLVANQSVLIEIRPSKKSFPGKGNFLLNVGFNFRGAGS